MLANNVVKERKPPIYRRYLPVIKCVYFVLTSTKKAHKKIPLTLTSQGYNKINECFTLPPNQPHQKTQADIALPRSVFTLPLCICTSRLTALVDQHRNYCAPIWSNRSKPIWSIWLKLCLGGVVWSSCAKTRWFGILQLSVVFLAHGPCVWSGRQGRGLHSISAFYIFLASDLLKMTKR